MSQADILLSSACPKQHKIALVSSEIYPMSNLRGQLFKKARLPRALLVLHESCRELSAFKILPLDGGM